MKDQISNNIALIDNWLLELSGRLLMVKDTPLSFPPFEQQLITEMPQVWLDSLTDGIKALLQLIDLIIVYDTLLHGEKWSFAWKDYEHLSPLHSILQPVN